MSLKVSIKGLNELQRKFDRGDKVVADNFGRAMFTATALIRADARRDAPSGVSSGGLKLKNNIFAKVVSPFKGVVGVNESIKYAESVEFGRKPGRMPPPDALEKWVRIKLGVPIKQVKGVAFAVARKIQRAGTEAQPYLLPAFEKNKQVVYRVFSRAVNNIVKEMN